MCPLASLCALLLIMGLKVPGTAFIFALCLAVPVLHPANLVFKLSFICDTSKYIQIPFNHIQSTLKGLQVEPLSWFRTRFCPRSPGRIHLKRSARATRFGGGKGNCLHRERERRKKRTTHEKQTINNIVRVLSHLGVLP